MQSLLSTREEEITLDNCIFCQIGKGKTSSYKIQETENFFAFLDNFPLTRGHTLIIPKKHYGNFFEVPEEFLSEMSIFTNQLAKKMKAKLRCEGMNVFHSSGKVAQQEVGHFHIHLIPRYEGENFQIRFEGNYKEKDFEKILEDMGGNK